MREQNGDSRIKRILNNEVAQLVAIIIMVYAFIALVMLPINSIQKDIANIQNNHLVHIQDSLNTIAHDKEINNQEHKEMLLQIEKTATILDQHLKK